MKSLLFLALIASTFYTCNKAKNSVQINGTFSGKFISGTPGATTVTDSQVTFNNDLYTSTKGSGTYKVQDNNLVSFKDENFWTANFDWGTILNGDYNYELKGDSLIMTKKASPALYQYRLKMLQ